MDLSKSGIYRILNLVNKKCYIGQTRNFIKRFSRHRLDLRENKHENQYLQNAWNKYGEENFEFSIIESNIEYERLNELEEYYIYFYNSFTDSNKSGYNLTKGGQKNRGISESTKEKIKKERTGKKLNLSDEGRIRKSESMKKLWAEDEVYRNKILNSLIGRPVSDETKEKIRVGNKGKIISEEQKKNHSLKMKGRIGPNKGKKYSDEIKQSFSKAQIGSKKAEGFSWVRFDKTRNKYTTIIHIGNKNNFFGRYSDEILAAQNGDYGFLQLSPFDIEFTISKLNFPELINKYNELLENNIPRITEQLNLLE